MDENSTQKYHIGETMDSTILKEQQPSFKTLNFLRTFARLYHVEPSLPDQMNEVCLN